MGNLLAPTLINICRCDLGERILDDCPPEFKPVFYFKNLDDSFFHFTCQSHALLYNNNNEIIIIFFYRNKIILYNEKNNNIRRVGKMLANNLVPSESSSYRSSLELFVHGMEMKTLISSVV